MLCQEPLKTFPRLYQIWSSSCVLLTYGRQENAIFTSNIHATWQAFLEVLCSSTLGGCFRRHKRDEKEQLRNFVVYSKCGESISNQLRRGRAAWISRELSTLLDIEAQTDSIEVDMSRHNEMRLSAALCWMMWSWKNVDMPNQSKSICTLILTPFMYRAALKGSSQVVWNWIKKFCLPTYCRHESAIFPPHIHSTWEEPFRAALYNWKCEAEMCSHTIPQCGVSCRVIFWQICTIFH